MRAKTIYNMYNTQPGQKIAVSQLPVHAPKNFRELDSIQSSIDTGEFSECFGSGTYSSLICEACGYGGAEMEDQKKNLCIYFLSNIQRNGNYSTLSEIICTNCQLFTTVETWEEG